MGRRGVREEIVEAALEQFHRHGYNAAGVKVITDAAGVPKGSFYNHFDSKEALAVVALQRYGARHPAQELATGDGEPLARLRAHFESLRDAVVGAEFTRGCLMGNFGAEIADHSGIIRDAVREGLAQWTDAIAGVLAEAHDAGALHAGIDPRATAGFLINAWEGSLIRARADRSAEAFDSFFALVFGALLPAGDREPA